MDEFINFILQFGNLNQQQIDLLKSKATKIDFQKDDYLAEAGKHIKQATFVLEGVFRVCYYTNKGDEVTRYFFAENHLLFDLHKAPLSEYIQALTDCKLIVFSNKDWDEISKTIVGWEQILHKIITKTMAEKLDRRSPLVAQDATTRYTSFLEKFPTIANRIPLSYIASYLGITQQSLSRIRKNIS